MKSIARIKPNMSVLKRDILPVSPFGMLSQAFTEEIMGRFERGAGMYPMYSLEYLYPDEDGSGEMPGGGNVHLEVQLKLILQQLKENKTNAAAERILKKTEELRLLREKTVVHHTTSTAGKPKPQRKSASDDRSMPWRELTQGVERGGIPDQTSYAQRNLMGMAKRIKAEQNHRSGDRSGVQMVRAGQQVMKSSVGSSDQHGTTLARVGAPNVSGLPGQMGHSLSEVQFFTSSEREAAGRHGLEQEKTAAGFVRQVGQVAVQAAEAVAQAMALETNGSRSEGSMRRSNENPSNEKETVHSRDPLREEKNNQEAERNLSGTSRAEVDSPAAERSVKERMNHSPDTKPMGAVARDMGTISGRAMSRLPDMEMQVSEASEQMTGLRQNKIPVSGSDGVSAMSSYLPLTLEHTQPEEASGQSAVVEQMSSSYEVGKELAKIIETAARSVEPTVPTVVTDGISRGTIGKSVPSGTESKRAAEGSTVDGSSASTETGPEVRALVRDRELSNVDSPAAYAPAQGHTNHVPGTKPMGSVSREMGTVSGRTISSLPDMEMQISEAAEQMFALQQNKIPVSGSDGVSAMSAYLPLTLEHMQTEEIAEQIVPGREAGKQFLDQTIKNAALGVEQTLLQIERSNQRGKIPAVENERQVRGGNSQARDSQPPLTLEYLQEPQPETAPPMEQMQALSPRILDKLLDTPGLRLLSKDISALAAERGKSGEISHIRSLSEQKSSGRAIVIGHGKKDGSANGEKNGGITSGGMPLLAVNVSTQESGWNQAVQPPVELVHMEPSLDAQAANSAGQISAHQNMGKQQEAILKEIQKSLTSGRAGTHSQNPLPSQTGSASHVMRGKVVVSSTQTGRLGRTAKGKQMMTSVGRRGQVAIPGMAGTDGVSLEALNAYPVLSMEYGGPLVAMARELRQTAQRELGRSGAAREMGMHIPAAKALEEKGTPETMQTLDLMTQPQIQEHQVVWQNPYMRSAPMEMTHHQKNNPQNQQRIQQSQPQVRMSDAEIRRAADKVFKLVQEKIIKERRRIGRM